MGYPSTDKQRQAAFELERRLQQRDSRMRVICATGALLAVTFLWVPSFVARAGAMVALLGLFWSSWQCTGWRRTQGQGGVSNPDDWRVAALDRLTAEMENVRSVFGLLLLLVSVNLVWWGLPLGDDEVVKAWSDCALLGCSVTLFGLLFWHKQSVTRRELAVFQQQFTEPQNSPTNEG